MAKGARIREAIRQTCAEPGVKDLTCGPARRHIQIYISAPEWLTLLVAMQGIEDRSSCRVPLEFPELRERPRGRRFRARVFSTTAGDVAQILYFGTWYRRPCRARAIG